MLKFYKETSPDVFEPLEGDLTYGEGNDAVTIPFFNFTIWAEADRNAIGVYSVELVDTPEGKTLVSSSVKRVNGVPTYIPVFSDIVPTQVALWQARAVLKEKGLFDTVDAFVEANKASNPVLDQVWNYGNNVTRNGLFVTSLTPTLLHLSDADLDALFIAANNLVA